MFTGDDGAGLNSVYENDTDTGAGACPPKPHESHKRQLGLLSGAGADAVNTSHADAETETETDALALTSDAPLHVNWYVVEATIGPMVADPLAPLLPAQPPDAVQLDALVELQVRVIDPPARMDVGEAARWTVGAVAVTMMVALSYGAPLGP